MSSSQKPQVKSSVSNNTYRYTSFWSIDPATLRSLPREVQIAYDDRKARRAKLRKAEAVEREEEKSEKHAAWRIRVENRERRAWNKDCLQSGACLNCGSASHRVVACEMVKAEPRW